MGGSNVIQQLLTSSELSNSSQMMLVKLLFHAALYEVHILNISEKKIWFRNVLDNLEIVLFGTVSAIHMSEKLVIYQGICRAEEKAIRLSEN